MRIPSFLLAQTVTVKPHLGHGGKGPIYGDAYTLKGQAQPSARLVNNDKGEEVTASFLLVCAPESAIQVPDWVVYGAVNYQVALIEKCFVGAHVNHIEATLISMGATM